jgi:hypothetical protein
MEEGWLRLEEDYIQEFDEMKIPYHRKWETGGGGETDE